MKKKWLNKFLKKNRKALSTVIITLIMIALALVLVAVVWVVVSNLIKGQTEGISLEKLTFDAEIKEVGIDNSTNNLTLTVQRKAGQGEITGMKFIFENDTDKEIETLSFTLIELGKKRFEFHLNIPVDSIRKISIVPLFQSSSGEETIGNVVDSYSFKGGESGSYSPPIPCTSDCTGKECGNDGCDGSCGTCSSGFTCNATGQCVAGSCDLTSASWSQTSVVNGTLVTMTAVGSGCTGVTLNYSIYEDDPLFDDYVTSFTSINFNQTWIALWTYPGDDDAGTDPRTYYFRVRVVGESEEVTSSNTLSVSQGSASCIPTTCAALGYNCGTWANGTCSGLLNCGNCSTGYSCVSGTCVSSCTPTTCAALGYECGTAANGTCAGTLSCGTCSSGYSCISGTCVEALTNVYYVSPTGGGNHNGSLGNRMTFNEAVAKANSEPNTDSIFYLADGNYGAATISGGNSRTVWATFRAENAGGALFSSSTQNVLSIEGNYDRYFVFDGIHFYSSYAGTMSTIISIYRSSFIKLKNCEINGEWSDSIWMDAYNILTYYAIRVYSTTNLVRGIYLEGCKIHNSVMGPIFLASLGDNDPDTGYVVIVNNSEIYNTARSVLDIEDQTHDYSGVSGLPTGYMHGNILIENNHIHDHHSKCPLASGPPCPDWSHASLLAFNTNNVIIRNNEIHAGGSTAGVGLYPPEEAPDPPNGYWENILIENNLIYDVTHTLMMSLDNVGAGSIIIRNNTLIGSWFNGGTDYNAWRYGPNSLSVWSSGGDISGLILEDNLVVGGYSSDTVIPSNNANNNIFWDTWIGGSVLDGDNVIVLDDSLIPNTIFEDDFFVNPNFSRGDEYDVFPEGTTYAGGPNRRSDLDYTPKVGSYVCSNGIITKGHLNGQACAS